MLLVIGPAGSSATPCAPSWKSHGPFTDSKNTFNSQSTFVLKLKVGSKFVYMYQGDRWNQGGPGSVGNATYIWLPLMPGNGTFSLSWHDTWKIGDFAV